MIMSAPVAQLDRALDYGSKGHGFESCRARHTGKLIYNEFHFYSKFEQSYQPATATFPQ